MSHLRDIMQKLSQNRSGSVPAAAAIPAASSAELARHCQHYRRQLRAASPAMLSYEWTWLHQHLEDLELCGATPRMLEVTGGRRHVDQLLDETRAYLRELGQEADQRGLSLTRQALSVVSGEHAWEVSNATIRAQWGLD
ncbi:MAG: hypothetical protein AAFX65_04780 [Cyanobacteria bacterium J06638_7]